MDPWLRGARRLDPCVRARGHGGRGAQPRVTAPCSLAAAPPRDPGEALSD